MKNNNYVSSKHVVQVPSMTAAEQIFHHRQGLKTPVEIEVEPSDPSSLQKQRK